MFPEIRASTSAANADRFDTGAFGNPSIDGASAFAYPLIFLPFISSAFVPTDTMPTPVRAFAAHQPVTAIVGTLRSLFTGQPVGTDIWTALAWCAGMGILAYCFAMRAYKGVP